MLEKSKIDRKMQDVQNTLDSIQATALWMMHHRDDAPAIVVRWLATLRVSSEEHRVTLWHLCNEVVQTCGRRRAEQFKNAFKSVLKQAVRLCSGRSSAPKVNRVVTIWRQRSVYDATFLDDLILSLYGDHSDSPIELISLSDDERLIENKKDVAVSSDVNSTHVAETSSNTVSSPEIAKFDAECLLSVLSRFPKILTQTSSLSEQLKLNRLPTLSGADLRAQVRDRRTGESLVEQYTQLKVLLTELVDALEAQCNARKQLLSLLSDAERFYEEQVSIAEDSAERVKKLESTMGQVTGGSQAAPAMDLNESAEMEFSEDDVDAEPNGKESRIEADTNADGTYPARTTTKAASQKTDSNALGSPELPAANLVFGAPLDAKAVEQMRKLLHSSSADRSDSPPPASSSRHRRHRDHGARERSDGSHDREEENERERAPKQSELHTTVSSSELNVHTIVSPNNPPVALPVQMPMQMRMPMSVNTTVQPFAAPQSPLAVHPQAPFAMQHGPGYYQPYPSPRAHSVGPASPFGVLSPTAPFSVPQTQLAASVTPFSYQQPVPPPWHGHQIHGPSMARLQRAAGFTSPSRYGPRGHMQQPFSNWQPAPKRSRNSTDELLPVELEYVPTDPLESRSRRVSSNNITLVDTSNEPPDDTLYSPTPATGVPYGAVPAYRPRAITPISPPSPSLAPMASRPRAQASALSRSGVKLPSFIAQSQPTAVGTAAENSDDLSDSGNPKLGHLMPIASLANPNRRSSVL